GFYFQAEDGIRDRNVTGVQTCALPISYRIQYADMLIRANNWNKALKTLQEGRRILSAANDLRPNFRLRMARVLIESGDEDAAGEEISAIKENELTFQQKLMLTRLYLKMDEIKKAEQMKPSKDKADVPLKKARWAYTTGLLQKAKDNNKEAIQSFRTAIEWNRYQLKARSALVEMLRADGNTKEAQKIMEQ